LVKSDDLDRILSEDEQILPSSGFANSVMDAVHQEAAVPPPIVFPWKRLLPGLCAAALTLPLAAAVVLLPSGAAPQTAPGPLLNGLASALVFAETLRLDWILLALGLSFVSVRLSARLARR
jgi:hypothetical protein